MRKMFHLTGLGVGAALLALCACTPASRAALIVNNLANTAGGHTGANKQLVQDFSTTVGGQITSVTLELYIGITGSVVVNLYSATSTGPGTLIGALGTITATTTGDNQQFILSGVNLANYSLTVGQDYGIEIAGTTTIGWDYTTGTANSGTGGAFLGNAWGNTSSPTPVWVQGGAYTMMSVSTVPEVPMTGWAMGFGVLAIAATHVLRKIKAAAPDSAN